MSYRNNRKRAGLVLPAIVGGAFLAVTALSPGCKGVVVTTIDPLPPKAIGEIGDPCLSPDERRPDFSGFKVTEINLVTGLSACNSGVCLINHIQGRADCPLGQAAPAPCAGPDDTSCGAGSTCTASAWTGPHCSTTSVDGGPPVQDPSTCASGACNSPHNTCQCTSDAQCPEGARCDPASKECRQYVCHRAGDCQSAAATDAENAGKSCCTPDLGLPVSAEVCGQCESRNAAEDIYCSCRCGPADGAPPDGAEYCSCPSGFECAPIVPFFSDDALGGRFCIKAGTAYQNLGTFPPPDQCGAVSGHSASFCAGTPAN